jgi:hypothetical protein
MPLSAEHKSELVKLAKAHSIQHQVGFKNFTQNVSIPDAMVLEVSTTTELQQIVRKVNELNKSSPSEKIILRVAAGGRRQGVEHNEYSQSFSMTPCAAGNVIVRLVGEEFHQMNMVKDAKNVVRVGANVQVGELDKALYKTHHLTLPTSSLIPHVTVVGLTANAGHGTGRDQPSVAGLIRSMRIMRPDGVIERINHTHPDFEIIRAGNLGLFGVVLDVDIECVPAKKLRCTTAPRSMNELIEEIESGLFYNHEYVSIMYIPTYQTDEANQRNIMVSIWDPVPLTVNDINNNPCMSHAEQSVAVELNNLINIPGFLTQHSSFIPAYMKYLVARSQVGTSSSTDAVSVGPWYDIAHYQTAYPWSIDDADYLFKTRGTNAPEIIRALRFVSEKLTDYTRRHQYPVIDAVYLRFFKGTNGGLSSSSTSYPDQHICGFDIVSNAYVPGYAEFKSEMDTFFFEQLYAKPHWGKSVPLNRDYSAIYGESFTQFMKALRRWYENCGMSLENSPFLNNFFRNILQVTVPMKQMKKEEKPTVPFVTPLVASQAHVVAQTVVSHLEKLNKHDEQLKEIKMGLQQIINTYKTLDTKLVPLPVSELKFKFSKPAPSKNEKQIKELAFKEEKTKQSTV